MRQKILIAFGLLEFAAPEWIIPWGEQLAFENPGTGVLRPWTLPMARLEGLLFCWLAASGRARSPVIGKLLGVVGLPALLFPKTFLSGALGMAYENPDDIEVKPWVVPFTRVLGAVYLAVALFSRRATGSEDERSRANS